MEDNYSKRLFLKHLKYIDLYFLNRILGSRSLTPSYQSSRGVDHASTREVESLKHRLLQVTTTHPETKPAPVSPAPSIAQFLHLWPGASAFPGNISCLRNRGSATSLGSVISGCGRASTQNSGSRPSEEPYICHPGRSMMRTKSEGERVLPKECCKGPNRTHWAEPKSVRKVGPRSQLHPRHAVLRRALLPKSINSKILSKI